MDLSVSFRLKISESCLQMLMGLCVLVYSQLCPSIKIKLINMVFHQGLKGDYNWLITVFIISLAAPLGNTKRILFPDWLPEWVGWAHLSHFDLAKKKRVERTYNVRNLCTISAQKAAEDS